MDKHGDGIVLVNEPRPQAWMRTHAGLEEIDDTAGLHEPIDNITGLQEPTDEAAGLQVPINVDAGATKAQ